MCMSCGCKQIDDNHGDQRHITMDTLQQAADAAGISVDEAARNIAAGVKERAPVGADSGDGSFAGEEPSEKEF